MTATTTCGYAIQTWVQHEVPCHEPSNILRYVHWHVSIRLLLFFWLSRINKSWELEHIRIKVKGKGVMRQFLIRLRFTCHVWILLISLLAHSYSYEYYLLLESNKNYVSIKFQFMRVCRARCKRLFANKLFLLFFQFQGMHWYFVSCQRRRKKNDKWNSWRTQHIQRCVEIDDIEKTDDKMERTEYQVMESRVAHEHKTYR